MINKLTKTTEFFDYVPVISTFKSLADLFTNYVILPKKTQIEIYQHHYYRLVDAKSVKRMLMLTVPVIGNIVVALYDLTHQKLNHQAAVLYEIKNSNFELVNEELKADKAFMLKAIRSNYNAYDLVCKELKYEVDIFRTALAHTSDILLTLPDIASPTSTFYTKDFYISKLDIINKISLLIGKKLNINFQETNFHDVPDSKFKGPF